jgi:hypothetical protein
MRTLALSLSGLIFLVVLIVVAPNLAKSQPSVLPLTYGQANAGLVEEVGRRYRRYRYVRPYYRPYYGYGYGYRPYYGYGYRPYYGYGYRPYGYYRPYYGGYGYPYWRRPGISFGFSF